MLDDDRRESPGMKFSKVLLVALTDCDRWAWIRPPGPIQYLKKFESRVVTLLGSLVFCSENRISGMAVIPSGWVGNSEVEIVKKRFLPLE